MTHALPTLIFIPGLAADARMWAAQRVAVPAKLRPRVSLAAQQPQLTTIEAMAAAVLAQNPGPLLLCGASMGGMLAMEAARQAPERVAGLALLGTTARPETPEMHALREAAIALFAQGKLREVIEPNVALAFHPRQAAQAALVQAYLDFVLDAGAEVLIRQNRAVMARPDARTHLPALRCPVLVLCGDSDALTPPECSQEIATLVPQAEWHCIADCGHMLTMEAPDTVNQHLLQWLQRHGWA
ncbi:MAG: alpha/beta fold hydrolase [Burkholderiaceae bacterium]